MIVKLFHLPQHGMERIHEPISHRYIALFQHCLRYYASELSRRAFWWRLAAAGKMRSRFL
jgi:hypothetical protein